MSRCAGAALEKSTTWGMVKIVPDRASQTPLRVAAAALSRTLHSGILLPLLFALAVAVASHFHRIFNEWGGVMQVFAGREILSGEGYTGWASDFWPPLFSVLVGLGDLVMPGFEAAKLISVVSGAGLIGITYLLALALTGDRTVAVWSQVFLALNPLFFTESFTAHNHMLDALLYCAAILVFLRAVNTPAQSAFFAAGVLSGLAALTRYTSYVLFLLCGFCFLVRGRKNCLHAAVAFLAGFVVVSLPWWCYLTVSSGSPLHSGEYLNLGHALFRNTWEKWWWKDQADFTGWADILFAFPGAYLSNFASNLKEGAKLIITSGGVLLPFVIPGLLERSVTAESKPWLMLFAIFGVELLLGAQAFFPYYALMSWGPIITIASVGFALPFLDRCEHRYRILGRVRFGRVARLAFLAGGVVLAMRGAVRFFATEESFGVLADVDAVTAALKKHDAGLSGKTIMAIDPARAYYAGSQYLATPLYFEGSAEELVQYEGLRERVKEYAPKYPSRMAANDLRADYLVYTRPDGDIPPWAYHEPPQFSFLLDPASAEVPAGFSLVFASHRVVVYEIAAEGEGTKR